jgi:hypothetical protein
MTDAVDALLRDPAYLPYRLDPVLRRVLWLRLEAASRAQAAFLDERAMPAAPQGGWTPIDVLARLEPPARPAHAIFHIGHCGSTLLSRVLEAADGIEGLREPLPLRTLAEAWPHRGAVDGAFSDTSARAALAGLWSAWSRPLSPGAEAVVVKATSRCNLLAAPLLEAFPATRAVLLDMPLRPWLATLFKSEAALTDALLPAGERLRFLQAQGVASDVALHGLSLPAQCALGWLAEQLRFEALATGDTAARVLRVDFDALLARPQAVLGAVAAHLGLGAHVADAAMRSPHWTRYSKAPEHGYGSDDRSHDLDLALRRFGAEVEAGIAAVHGVLAPHPALQARLAARLG